MVALFLRFVCALLVVSSLGAIADVEDKYQFSSAEREKTFKELTQELRCPKCQNQNIADSDAIVAKDMRDRVEGLVQEGKSKQEVIDFMIDRYGYFVHYQPPVTASTIVLWVLPVLILFVGFGFIVLRQRKASVRAEWSASDEQKLAELVKQYQRKEREL